MDCQKLHARHILTVHWKLKPCGNHQTKIQMPVPKRIGTLKVINSGLHPVN